MNSFNKTEAAVFSCRLCFLRAFPFISLMNMHTWIPHSDFSKALSLYPSEKSIENPNYHFAGLPDVEMFENVQLIVKTV